MKCAISLIYDNIKHAIGFYPSVNKIYIHLLPNPCMISDAMSTLLSSSAIKDMTYLRLRLTFDGANKLVLC